MFGNWKLKGARSIIDRLTAHIWQSIITWSFLGIFLVIMNVISAFCTDFSILFVQLLKLVQRRGTIGTVELLLVVFNHAFSIDQHDCEDVWSTSSWSVLSVDQLLSWFYYADKQLSETTSKQLLAGITTTLRYTVMSGDRCRRGVVEVGCGGGRKTAASAKLGNLKGEISKRSSCPVRFVSNGDSIIIDVIILRHLTVWNAFVCSSIL